MEVYAEAAAEVSVAFADGNADVAELVCGRKVGSWKEVVGSVALEPVPLSPEDLVYV